MKRQVKKAGEAGAGRRSRRILVVEDDRRSCSALQAVLEDAGYAVRTAATGVAALDRVRDWPPHILICDYLLPDGLDGVAMARELYRRDPDLRIILMSGLPLQVIEAQVQGLSAHAILHKPVSIFTMLETVADADATLPS